MSAACTSAVVDKVTGRLLLDGEEFPYWVTDDVQVEGLSRHDLTVVRLGVIVDGTVEVITKERHRLVDPVWGDRDYVDAMIARQDAYGEQLLTDRIAIERAKAQQFLMLKVIRVRHELGLDPSDFVGKP